MLQSLLVVVSLAASLVAAHGGVIAYTIDGKKFSTGKIGSGATRLVFSPEHGNNPQRPWTSLGPVRSSQSPNIACNTPGTPSRNTMGAAAGGKITAHYNNWPHNGGPVSVWMVECAGESCASFTSPHTAQWFKLHQEGLGGASTLKRNANSLTVTIPESLKPGNYLIRHEIINLARPPAEFYVECAQLKITGKGTEKPGAAYRSTFAKAYPMSLPQFTQSYDSWKPKAAQYKLPGPAPWTGQKSTSKAAAAEEE